ncbi:DUF5309 family protein [Candidatus Woesearchaeota archaeon]|nr:DUF5309 family protein [Candidatus Woesearchaeota archaeon]
MANTGAMNSSFNASGAYAQSFGAMPDRTRYTSIDVKSGNVETDFRSDMFGKNNIGLKALNSQTGGAGTAGYALVPVYVDPKIIDQTRKYTPLCEIIPRVTNYGLTADYNVITAKGGGFVAAEDASLSETNTTYDRKSTSIKFLYSVGRVTGPAHAAIPPYAMAGFQAGAGESMGSGFADAAAPNSKQLEVLVKARELKELEENLIVNGDTDDDTNEFNGIIDLMSTTNTVDKNTTDLDLDDINTAVQYAFDDGGRPNLAVCSSAVYTDLLNLLQQRIGYMTAQQNVFWGFQSIVVHTMVGPITVIPSMYMSNTSGSKAMYLLDLSVVEMRVLQDMTYQELAKTNDSDKFMLKMYEALIIRNTAFCASITEIK